MFVFIVMLMRIWCGLFGLKLMLLIWLIGMLCSLIGVFRLRFGMLVWVMMV